MGKTRLALKVATDLREAFPHGVVFVALAPLRNPGLVIPAIGQTVGIQSLATQPLEAALAAHLRDRQVLLLLDNFEQVLSAAPHVAQLLAAAPRLKVLVTSRAALRLSGEHEFEVPPLGLPDPAHLPPLVRLAEYEAVRLFMARAQAVQPNFVLTDANAPAVAEICAKLDGLPLAIELAAVRIKLFTVQALLARLGSRLDVLTGGPRDLPARQQTLRTAIDWSYDLLTAGEQRLFRRLGVFVGGCSLEAVEAVCSAASDLPLNVLDGLATLVDHSLLQQAAGWQGEPRLSMLETIHEYALEQLEASAEADLVRRQHATYYLALAELAETQLHGAEQRQWLARLDEEHDNLRAALAWCQRAEEGTELGLRLAGALHEFWSQHANLTYERVLMTGVWKMTVDLEPAQDTYLREGRAWLTGMLARSGAPTAARGKALNALGHLTVWSDAKTARALHDESLAIGQTLGDRQIVADAFRGLAWLEANVAEDAARATALYEEALALYQAVGNTLGQIRTLHDLGLLTGDPERASTLFEQSLALSRGLADEPSIAWAHHWLGRIAREQNDMGKAISHYEAALPMYRQLGDKLGIAWVLLGLGDVEQWRGDYEQAAAYLEEGLELWRELGSKRLTAWALDNLGDIALYRGEAVRALALYRESLALFLKQSYPVGMAMCLIGFGGVAGASGEPERGATLCSAAYTLLAALGENLPADDRIHYDRIMAAIRARLDEAAFAAAWSKGQAMSREQAIAYALEVH